jgi:acyl-CoA synthetase (AMP-forming)/AMP-acid ligase II
LGEAIKAVIVLNNPLDQQLMKEKILLKCSEKLSLYKIPQYFEFENNIAVNAAGKKIKK